MCTAPIFECINQASEMDFTSAVAHIGDDLLTSASKVRTSTTMLRILISMIENQHP